MDVDVDQAIPLWTNCSLIGMQTDLTDWNNGLRSGLQRRCSDFVELEVGFQEAHEIVGLKPFCKHHDTPKVFRLATLHHSLDILDDELSVLRSQP